MPLVHPSVLRLKSFAPVSHVWPMHANRFAPGDEDFSEVSAGPREPRG
jgi:hypothetical protein